MSLAALDAALFTALYAQASMRGVMGLFGFVTLLGGGAGALFVLPFLALRRTRSLGVRLVIVLSVTALAVVGLKAAFGRPRPFRVLEGVTAHVLTPPSDGSFPSGHAAGSFAFAALVSFALARAGLPRRLVAGASLALFGLASLVALSRVALGVHYPADVAAGAFLGVAIAAAGARGLPRATGA